MAVEILQVKDVGVSLKDQNDKLNGIDKPATEEEDQEDADLNDNKYLDPTLAVAVRQKNIGNSRMYKLKATCDGISSFDCMEFKMFGHIDSIVAGEKYLIRATQ